MQDLPYSQSIIVAMWNDQSIKNIIPDFKISKGAKLSTDIEQGFDFSKDQIFEVISESGISRNYIVRFVKIAAIFLNDHSKNVYNGVREGELSFWTTYSSYSKVVSAQLISEDTKEQVEIDVSVPDVFEKYIERYIYFKLNEPLQGNYLLRVQLESGEDVVTRAKFSFN